MYVGIILVSCKETQLCWDMLVFSYENVEVPNTNYIDIVGGTLLAVLEIKCLIE